jgi:hypothetical protein
MSPRAMARDDGRLRAAHEARDGLLAQAEQLRLRGLGGLLRRNGGGQAAAALPFLLAAFLVTSCANRG